MCKKLRDIFISFPGQEFHFFCGRGRTREEIYDQTEDKRREGVKRWKWRRLKRKKISGLKA